MDPALLFNTGEQRLAYLPACKGREQGPGTSKAPALYAVIDQCDQQHVWLLAPL